MGFTGQEKNKMFGLATLRAYDGWVGTSKESGEMTSLHVHTACLFHPEEGSSQSKCAVVQLQAEGIREQSQKQEKVTRSLPVCDDQP